MKILIISPHTDDAELGAAGTIYKNIQQYGPDSVKIITMSHIYTHPQTGESIDLLPEWINSCNILGITQYSYFNLPPRNFHLHRQQILDIFITIKNSYQPDIIYIPSTFDTHQDHQIISAEAIRAFKFKTILGYILPHNLIASISINYFIELTDKEVAMKLDALSQYKSQQDRNYMQPAVIKSSLISIGSQINLRYAECFEIIRMVQLC